MAKKKASKSSAKKKAKAKMGKKPVKKKITKIIPKSEAVAKKKKLAAKKESPLKRSDILMIKFEAGESANPEKVYVKKTPDIPDSPPFIKGDDENAKQIRKLLLLKEFDTPNSVKVVKEEVPISELLMIKFKVGKSVKPEKVCVEKTPDIADSPPFIKGGNENTEEIRKLLLLKKFDTPNSVKEVKKEIPISELLMMKFEVGESAKPKKVCVKKIPDIPDSPPFIKGDDENAEQIRKLLFLKEFDAPNSVKTEEPMEEAPEPPAEKAKKPEPVEEVPEPSVEEKEPEPSIEEIKEQEPIKIAPSATNEVKATFEENEVYDEIKETDFMSKPLKYAVYGILCLFALLIITSSYNSDKYHLIQKPNGVELWKGTFAPMGTELVAQFKGIKAPEPIKNFYEQTEVYNMISNTLLTKVDELLSEIKRIPNFTQIKEYLDQAALFATTSEMNKSILYRSKGIDFWVLLYRADMAMLSGVKAGMESARIYLVEAASFAMLDYQKAMLKQRVANLSEAIAALEPAVQETTVAEEVEETEEEDAQEPTSSEQDESEAAQEHEQESH
ncbi:conserved hypothetical protein [Candidatus Magnetomoraceae bacterium gMMP-15]